LTSFEDYPQEKYDKKVPWYTWLKEQIRRKDAWKRRMEEKVRKLFENRPKHATKNIYVQRFERWFDEAEKEIFGRETKK